MKKLLFLLSASLLVLTSCSNNDSSSANSQYQGNWSGNYTGSEDHGSWIATINSSGIATGTTTSAVFSGVYELNGTVNSQGVFAATIGTASSGAHFNGQMNESSASGTWVNNSAEMNGNWTGTKQ